MIILIDDERNVTPDGHLPDLIARNFLAGRQLLFEVASPDDIVYIDHDLGEDRTGYDLLVQLEALVVRWRENDDSSFYLPAAILVVSDNGPGRARMAQVIERLYNPQT